MYTMVQPIAPNLFGHLSYAQPGRSAMQSQPPSCLSATHGHGAHASDHQVWRGPYFPEVDADVEGAGRGRTSESESVLLCRQWLGMIHFVFDRMHKSDLTTLRIRHAREVGGRLRDR